MRGDFKKICDAFAGLSNIARLRDKVAIATRAHDKRCGNCIHWMKSRSCPRENNIDGMSRGPSCDDPVCSKFSITKTAIENQKRCIHEAINFAKENDLPIPDYLKMHEAA
jgi:hypothetical protein